MPSLPDRPRIALALVHHPVLRDRAGTVGSTSVTPLNVHDLARALDLPRGAAVCLFALGRSIGWIAHALETRGEGRLIRPRARYTGPEPLVGSSIP